MQIPSHEGLDCTEYPPSARPSAFLSCARKGVRHLIRLELKPNESLDKALRRFKKICDREGLTRDMRKHSYYEKPSEKNKRKDREREKERAKAIRVAEKKKNKARKARAKSLKKLATGGSGSGGNGGGERERERR